MKYLKYRKIGNMQAEVAGGVIYAFISKHDIALCQVQEEHIGELLMKRCGCCGSEFGCFTFASQAEIDLWNSPED